MKIVRPDKEFTLTATVKDERGRLTDPETQEITIKDPWKDPIITLTTPERVDKGLYRAVFKLPKDVEEGTWIIEWLITVHRRAAVQKTEIQVSRKVIGKRELQMEVRLKDYFINFIGEREVSSIMLKSLSKKVLVDCGEGKSIPEGVTEIIVTHAHPENAFGLKSKKLSYPVYVNKFTNPILVKKNFPFRRKIFWKKAFQIGEMNITPVPVLHSVNAPMTGLIIELGGYKVGYFPEVLGIHDKSVLNQLNLYIGDGKSLDEDIVSQREKKKFGHASIRTQLAWLQKAGVKRALFVNLGKWARDSSIVREVFKALGVEFDMKVVAVNSDYRIHISDKLALQKRLPRVTTLEDLLSHCRAPIALEKGSTVIISGTVKPGEMEGSVELQQMQGDETLILLNVSDILPPDIAERLLQKYSDKYSEEAADSVRNLALSSGRRLATIVDMNSAREKEENPKESNEQ
ncbi:MAG: hypothetical protein AM326_03065 [Candidatus Thorarchaeota archaeon SMTZ-45]|nr:MAG: hypothetical protein AM326_03065 [Candidatus Thorarchaeota archaeon SMTZ-45]